MKTIEEFFWVQPVRAVRKTLEQISNVGFLRYLQESISELTKQFLEFVSFIVLFQHRSRNSEKEILSSSSVSKDCMALKEKYKTCVTLRKVKKWHLTTTHHVLVQNLGIHFQLETFERVLQFASWDLPITILINLNKLLSNSASVRVTRLSSLPL